jgi:phosphoribosylglycinamide formyltransferase 1
LRAFKFYTAFKLRQTSCALSRPAVNRSIVTAHAPLRIGVLGSGKGSNFVAIADAIARGDVPAEVAIVISDVETAGLLQHARDRGFPAEYVFPGKFRTKLDEETERAYISRLQEARVDIVVLAGFMRILKGDFLRAFPERVVNIHPSLLPAFPGLEAWKQALAYGVKVTGCTVHFVDQGVDSGPIIAQEVVPVLDGDTAETLHERVQQAERRVYPAVIKGLAERRVVIKGRQTVWLRGEQSV